MIFQIKPAGRLAVSQEMSLLSSLGTDPRGEEIPWY